MNFELNYIHYLHVVCLQVLTKTAKNGVSLWSSELKDLVNVMYDLKPYGGILGISEKYGGSST